MGDVKLVFLDAFQSAANTELDELVHEATVVPDGLGCVHKDILDAHKEALAWRVAAWAATRNRNGSAPSTSAMLLRYELLRVEVPEIFRPSAIGLAMTPSNRKFMHRLRKRLGGRIGKVRFQDRISAEDARSKTFAVWQWSNYLASKIPEGKTPLWINMDETSVSLIPEGTMGNIFLSKGEGPTQQATTNERRTHLTHVSFVCSDPEVQRRLPQFIIGNEHSIPAHRLAELQSLCPESVHVWRLPSSWVKGYSCRAMLSLLAMRWSRSPRNIKLSYPSTHTKRTST